MSCAFCCCFFHVSHLLYFCVCLFVCTEQEKKIFCFGWRNAQRHKALHLSESFSFPKKYSFAMWHWTAMFSLYDVRWMHTIAMYMCVWRWCQAIKTIFVGILWINVSFESNLAKPWSGFLFVLLLHLNSLCSRSPRLLSPQLLTTLLCFFFGG